jgi:hypothetical protein
MVIVCPILQHGMMSTSLCILPVGFYLSVEDHHIKPKYIKAHKNEIFKNEVSPQV